MSRKPSLADNDSRTELITRREAAALLGLSEATVRRREGTELPVTVGDDGVHRFRREDVDAYAASIAPAPPPPEASTATIRRAFELFASGATLPEIVVALDIPPSEVRRLYAEWTAPLGATPRQVAEEDPERRVDRDYRSSMRAWEEERRALAKQQEREDEALRRQQAAIEEARREIDRKRESTFAERRGRGRDH